MILNALMEYAQTRGLLENPDYEERRISCQVRIGRNGELIGIEPVFEINEKGKTFARMIEVPRGEGRTSGAFAYFLADKADYVFGVLDDSKKSAKEKKLQERHDLFTNRVQVALDATQDKGLEALLQFCRRVDTEQVLRELPENLPPGEQYVFVFDPDIDCYIHERPKVKAYWEAQRQASMGDVSEADFLCLVSGMPCVPEATHPKIKGVPGATSSGASLISFNFDASKSYGKDQNLNAPISREAAEAYTTALNHLLTWDNGTSFRISANTVVVFWTKEKKQGFETIFGQLMRADSDSKALFESPYRGLRPYLDDPDGFYALILTGAQGRIMIRDWFETTIGEIANRINEYFDELALSYPYDDPPPLGIQRLLESTVLEGKAENIPDNLSAQFSGAIFRGGPFPLSLLSATTRRNRAEGPMPEYNKKPNWKRAYTRTALTKACLIRNAKKNIFNLSIEEIPNAMDANNTNTAYRLGRLFCLLEILQARAIGNPNATVADRFFGAASTTPSTVFPRLIRLSKHHSSKLEKQGQWGFQKEITEIFETIDGFPSVFDLKDQGMFALGYYHQRAEHFRKKDSDNENTDAAKEQNDD